MNLRGMHLHFSRRLTPRRKNIKPRRRTSAKCLAPLAVLFSQGRSSFDTSTVSYGERQLQFTICRSALIVYPPVPNTHHLFSPQHRQDFTLDSLGGEPVHFAIRRNRQRVADTSDFLRSVPRCIRRQRTLSRALTNVRLSFLATFSTRSLSCPFAFPCSPVRVWRSSR